MKSPTCWSLGCLKPLPGLKSDSELIVNQVYGNYEAKGESMKRYLNIAKGLVTEIPQFSIEFISLNDNQLENSLSKLAFGGTRIREVQFLECSPYPILENKGEVFNI